MGWVRPGSVSLMIVLFIVFNFLFNRRENPEEVEDFVLYWQ